MPKLSLSEAQRLYDVLDGTLGVFKFKDVPEKYHKQAKSDFLEVFTNDVPDSYWFQSDKCASVSLIFDSTGFWLKTDSVHKREQRAVEEAYQELHNAKIVI